MTKNRIKIEIFILSLLCCFFAFPLFSVAKAEEQYQINNNFEKAYKYEVFQESGKYNIIGSYVNNSTYTVATGASFQSIISYIDYDRYALSYEECYINFNNIVVGNASLKFSNGKYNLSGKVNGNSYSYSGLFFVDSSNVTILKDSSFSNSGLASLFVINNNAVLNIDGGELKSIYSSIENRGGGLINVYSGTIYSETSSAVVINKNGDSKLFIDCLDSQYPIVISSKDNKNGTINVKDCDVFLGNCIIKNDANYYALNLLDSKLHITKNPIFLTDGIAVKTNSEIVASYLGDEYLGDIITIDYYDEIVSGATICVENVTEQNFDKFVLNSNIYKLRKDWNNLVAENYYSLKYDLNSNISFIIPEDIYECSKTYFSGDEIELSFFLNDNVRAHYSFLGWSKNKNDKNPTYTLNNKALSFESSNIVLYAIWEPIFYSISYENVEDDEIEGYLTSYSVETNSYLVKNPERKYFSFDGWIANDNSIPQKNYSIKNGSYGNLTLKAVWSIGVYNINFISQDGEMINGLTCKKTYTIFDEPFELLLDCVMEYGYSYFGIYLDKDCLIEAPDKIYFKLDDLYQNSNDFNELNSIGQDINFYVLRKKYFTSGNGSLDNPFIIETDSEFENFLEGFKKKEKSIYIDFKNDLSFSNNISNSIFEGLENICINGNNNIITISQYNNFDDKISLFCRLKNVSIYDLVITSNKTILINNLTQNLDFGGIIGEGENVVLRNVTNKVNVNIVSNNTDCVSNFCIGGIASKLSESSLIDDCFNFGNISLFVEKEECLETNIAGIVSQAENTRIINSGNYGNINIDLTKNKNDNRSYVAGIGILYRNSKIFNSFNYGELIINDNKNDWQILTGIAIVFDYNCEINNVLNNIKFKQLDNDKKMISPIFWSGQISCSINNAFSFEDSTYYVFDGIKNKYINQKNKNITSYKLLNSVLEKLNMNLEDASFNNLNVQAKRWFLNKEGLFDFTPLLLVNYNLMGKLSNKTISYKPNTDITGFYEPIVYLEFSFGGWFKDETLTEKADLSNLGSGEVTLFAKWISFDEQIKREFVLYILIDMLIIVIMILCMFLIDMKKKIVFICDNKEIDSIYVARTKTIIFPKGLRTKMWYKDEKLLKPYLSSKMTWHKISLYTSVNAPTIPEKTVKEKKIKIKKEKVVKEKIKKEKPIKVKREKVKNFKKENSSSIEKINIKEIKRLMAQKQKQEKEFALKQKQEKLLEAKKIQEEKLNLQLEKMKNKKAKIIKNGNERKKSELKKKENKIERQNKRIEQETKAIKEKMKILKSKLKESQNINKTQVDVKKDNKGIIIVQKEIKLINDNNEKS